MTVDPLNAVRLTHKEAEELLTLDTPLHLPALKHLDPSAARVLSQCRHGIVLRSLPALTLEAAKELAPHQWGLHLMGLVSVSRELGDALAKHKGTLLFGDSLTSLESPALARHYARLHKWDIALNGLQTLSPEVARAMAYDGKELGTMVSVSFNGLRELTAETAAELLCCCSSITLHGLSTGHCKLGQGAEDILATTGDDQRLLVSREDSDIAAFLSRDYSERLMSVVIRGLNTSTDGERDVPALNLDSMTSLSLKQARAISEFDGYYVNLRGLAEIPSEIAVVLAGMITEYTHVSINPRELSGSDLAAIYVDAYRDCPSDFFCDPPCAIEAMSPEAAAVLIAAGASLSLPKMRHLSVELAETLATSNQPLYLDGLEELTLEVAVALAGHRNTLSLDGLATISYEALCAFADRDRNWGLVSLNGLRKADLRCQALLSCGAFDRSRARRFDNEDEHGGCTFIATEELTLADAKAIPEDVWEPCFYKLKSLSPDVAEYLAWRFLKMSFPGLETLSASAAQAFEYHGRKLLLDGLECINSTAAAALASHKGLGLSLGGLNSLMPEEAAALAHYHDVITLARDIHLAPEDRRVLGDKVRFVSTEAR